MPLGVIVITVAPLLSPLRTVSCPVASEIIPAAVNFISLAAQHLSIPIIIFLTVFLCPVCKIPNLEIKINRSGNSRYSTSARTLPHTVFTSIAALGIVLCNPAVPFREHRICQIIRPPVQVCINPRLIPCFFYSSTENLSKFSD